MSLIRDAGTTLSASFTSGDHIITPRGILSQQGTFVPLTPISSRCYFVDGGSGILMSSPDFCVAIVRTAGMVFSGGACTKRIQRTQIVTVRAIDGKPTFELETFPKSSVMKFDGIHEDLKRGTYPCLPEDIITLHRRLQELQLALNLCQGCKEIDAMNADDFLVLDGELRAQTLFEEKVLKEITELHANTVGVVKQTGSFTNTGSHANRVLLELGPKGTWLYTQNDLPTGFVRLHARSSHVFRIDSTNSEVLARAANVLSFLSNDALLAGYPYGLIAVDNLAKVSTSELAVERLSLLTTPLAKQLVEHPHAFF